MRNQLPSTATSEDHSNTLGSTACLCVGAVTKNVIQAVVDYAYETDVQMMLIASRRQVDLPALGSGYLEHWSAADLMQFVERIDPQRKVKVCRDHGGPWQNPVELLGAYDERAAMVSALTSMKADIDAGFRVIHIDTSVAPNGSVSHEDAIQRLLYLYEQLCHYVRSKRAEVDFEIGFEDQTASVAEPETFHSLLIDVLAAMESKGLPRPAFVVAQTGTKVFQTRNVGAVTDGLRSQEVTTNLGALTSICRNMDVALKAHNCDYLPEVSWNLLKLGGVRCANVAPEYGVTETKCLLAMLDEAGLSDRRVKFLQIAYDSGRWKKWVEDDADPDYVQCGIIAGHYVLSDPEVRSLTSEVARRLYRDNMEELNATIQRALTSLLDTHAHWLGLLPNGAGDQVR